MVTQNATPPKPTRACRRCKKSMELKDFETRRHKTCIPCQIAIRRDGVIFNEETRKFQSIKTLGPALTSTSEGRKKYNNERYRIARANDPNAKMPLVMPTTKLCRRCQTLKPLSEFGSWRVRICLACDGPTLESLLRRNQR